MRVLHCRASPGLGTCTVRAARRQQAAHPSAAQVAVVRMKHHLSGSSACFFGFFLPVAGSGRAGPNRGGDTRPRAPRPAPVQVGSDFVCCSPLWDPTGNTPRVAAIMMFEQLCLVAESKAAKKDQGGGGL